MSGENESTATGNTAVEDESSEHDADFAAGFNGQDSVPTETPAPAPTPEPTPEPTPAPTPAPEYVQVTRADWERINASAAKVDEIAATVGKMPDQIYGTMGRTLDRRLSEIAQATPKGETVQIDEADFEDLKREYPEMAELTLKGLNKAIGKLKGTGVSDPEAIQRVVTEQITTVRGEIVEASLEAVFPGWKDEVKTKEFNEWISTQPGWSPVLNDKQAYQLALSDPKSALNQWVKANPNEPVALMLSSKVGDAAKMLRLYEKSKEAPKPTPSPTPAPAQTPAPSPRQRQIAAAVVPRGDGGSPPPASTEDDDFAAGFKYRSG